MLDLTSYTRALYDEMIINGVAREQARMVLPQNMYTEFYASVNLHNLAGFLKLRTGAHAQWEIRQYAKALVTLVEPIVPNSLGALRTARNW